MLNPHFAIVGALLVFFSDATYAVDTFRGRARPNLVTWFLWGLAPAIAFGAELTQHVGLPSLFPLAIASGPVLVLLAALTNKKHPIWQLRTFDYACGALSIIAAGFWLDHHGNLAILFSVLADFLAGVPTIVKAFNHPDSETWFPYALGSAAALITLLSIHHWTFSSACFPLFSTLSCLNLTLLIRVRWGLKFGRQS